MFLKNHWYAAAFSVEVKQEILARTLLNEEVIIYRTAAGEPVVLEDKCAHRGLPLSMGWLVGDDVQCGYHGLIYDKCGACTHVPSQRTVPRGATVRAFPAIEKHGFVWAWMGEAEKADPSTIPDYSPVDDTRLLQTKFHVVLDCNYQLHIDNLLDLSHIGYVHNTTTGNEDIGENTDVITERDGDTVLVVRRQSNIQPPEIFRRFGGFDGLVDMWQVTRFNPPTYVDLSYGSSPAGEMDVNDRDIWSHGQWGFKVFQGVTPETDRTSHQMRYIMVEPGNFTDESFAELERLLDQVSMEDAPVLARQQMTLDRTNSDVRDFISRAPIKADQGLIMAREIIERRLRDAGDDGLADAAE